MGHTVDTSACDRYYGSMPIAFAIVELVVDSEEKPVDFIVRYANTALTALENIPAEKLLGRRFFADVFPGESNEKRLAHYFASAFHGQVCELHEYRCSIGKHLKVLSYPWHAAGFCACLLIDETEQTEQWGHLGYLASYDALTHTLNQNSYHEFCAAFRPGSAVGVVFVDVNGLKACNDSYGHQTGDLLIQMVIERMAGVMADRPHLAFRVGGDEFAVVMQGCTEDMVRDTAEELRKAFVNDSAPHFPLVLAAVGYSWNEQAQSIDSILKQADAAMYASKEDYYKRKNEIQSNDWQRALPRIRNMIDHKMTSNENKCQQQMWKESYRIGVERIDAQHIELFRMADELLLAVASHADSQTYRRILGFLKEYVVYHFRDEEEYQQSVGYVGFEAHRREHQQFTQTVLDYEKKLVDSDFALADVKDLAGTVIAWLVYHVTDADQKIVSGQVEPQQTERSHSGWLRTLADSAARVIEKAAGLQPDSVQRQEICCRALAGDVIIEITLLGDIRGRVLFGVSNALALNVFSRMTMRQFEDVDELVRSSICEFSGITCKQAAMRLSGQGLHCMAGPPVVLPAAVGDELPVIRVETAAGALDVALDVRQAV